MADHPEITEAAMRKVADHCLRWKQFAEFSRWLDGEVRRLKPATLPTTELLVMANAALAAWPDSARSPEPEWFLRVEENGTYEYGVNSTGSDFTYRGFKRGHASWLLPLCRTVHFPEAESIFPSVTHVQDCAAVFQDVPLTAIHFTGGMKAEIFEAFVSWAGTHALTTLVAHDYSTDRNSVSNLTDSLRKKLAEFKAQRHLV